MLFLQVFPEERRFEIGVRSHHFFREHQEGIFEFFDNSFGQLLDKNLSKYKLVDDQCGWKQEEKHEALGPLLSHFRL